VDITIGQFLKRQSNSGSRSAENVSDKRLGSEVQPAQCNESTANLAQAVGSSSPMQTQVSAIHSDKDKL